MQRFICQFLAAASLWIGWQAGEMFGRPRYGGNLRVETHEKIRSLDPADWVAGGMEPVKEKLISLVFERLTRLDENNRPQASLALAWQADSKNMRWQFQLRTDVKFHDGSGMTPEIVATALRSSAPAWKINVSADSLFIEADAPMPDLPFVLAQRSHSIYIRSADQKTFGTGPFQLVRLDPDRHIILAANEQHWAGRPFLDGVTIEMDRALKDQLTDLELGKSDLVEIWPVEMHRIPKETKIWASFPHVLIALSFERGRPFFEDAQIREAIALSIDRSALYKFLQKQGEIAVSLLPQKLSGYAFLFSAKTEKKTPLALKPGQPMPALSLAYDASDPLADIIASRIALDAQNAAIPIRPTRQSLNPDMRLIRLSILTPVPALALTGLLAPFRLNSDTSILDASSIEELYATENAVISGYKIIPLLYVPELYGSSPRLKAWTTNGIEPFGNWRLDDMWLDVEKP
jgi:peptide/nickel transport system substrate-binding protein